MSYFTWITPTVAIGELNAHTTIGEDLDIIVNLAYINPVHNHGLEHRTVRESWRGHIKVYEIGVYDTDSDVDFFKEVMEQYVPVWLKETGMISKIMFQCQAGKSRSVCMALAFLCKQIGLNVDYTLNMIKNARPVAAPRESFVNAVRTYLK